MNFSLIIFTLFLVLFAGLIVTFFAYVYVDLTAKNRRQDKVISSHEWTIEAQEVKSDGVLPASSVLLGFINLETFARKQKPDYIVGINRGGWLLSSYLAHRLSIPRERLLRFDSDKDDIIDKVSASEDIYTNSKAIILLIDDISRSGKSIDRSVRYVEDNLASHNTSVAVLVNCGRKTDKNINYNPYWTMYKDIQLPWSSNERKEEVRKIIGNQGTVVQLRDRDSLGRKLPILRVANDDTEKGGEMDISTDDMEAMLGMFLANHS